MSKQWEYSGGKNEQKLMNFMGKAGWEAYHVTPNGWVYYKRPMSPAKNTTGVTYKKKDTDNG